ncbi:MAG: nucleoside-diphosphate kinase [Candidatus Parcubacteria bacterium]|nr:MAG: nucleoside-diphosphate kinase [Candidatus Parcubacteria bacterium]
MKNTKTVIETTLVLIKPDGVIRKLVGEIISRFERANLDIVGLGIVQPTYQLIDRHYPKDKKWIENLGNNLIKTAEELKLKIDLQKDYGVKDIYSLGLQIRKWLIDFMTSGPIVKIALRGPQAVSVVRKLVGKTVPFMAEPGTIRGDFSIDSPILANLEKRPIKNLVHASGNIDEAKKELRLWFKNKELL